MNIALELTQVTLGIFCGIAAVAFFWVTVRTVLHGRSAYEANRSAYYPGIKRAFLGILREPSSMIDRRTSEGLAIGLKSRKLIAQQRLSSEALDDVMGRRV
ncbi:hypothetical protein SAMN04488005_2441 [Yoonia tamlensis]|uniref:Uncharacterized protein n=1 Tax=Yoonia tamlensis TaxID=390270 RepID=A0A1I6HAD0_9RHOB|nr:hypothetical protein SAMN04488005_2441 [Yoonia tamlensis]